MDTHEDDEIAKAIALSMQAESGESGTSSQVGFFSSVLIFSHI